jgi:hypothetical protein
MPVFPHRTPAFRSRRKKCDSFGEAGRETAEGMVSSFKLVYLLSLRIAIRRADAQ